MVKTNESAVEARSLLEQSKSRDEQLIEEAVQP